jgi:hypothetical protein
MMGTEWVIQSQVFQSRNWTSRFLEVWDVLQREGVNHVGSARRSEYISTGSKAQTWLGHTTFFNSVTLTRLLSLPPSTPCPSFQLFPSSPELL